MTDELVAVSELLKTNSTPLEELKFIENNDNFSTEAVALCIILTTPVSQWRI